MGRLSQFVGFVQVVVAKSCQARCWAGRLVATVPALAVLAAEQARFVHADVPADDTTARLALGRVLRSRNPDAERLGDSSIVDRNNIRDAIEEARRERPEQVGLRPIRVYPSLLRTDWDLKLTETGLEHLARQAA